MALSPLDPVEVAMSNVMCNDTRSAFGFASGVVFGALFAVGLLGWSASMHTSKKEAPAPALSCPAPVVDVEALARACMVGHQTRPATAR